MTSFETRLVHRGKIDDESSGAASTPIYQTATFDVSRNEGRWDYSRSGNPTRQVLEEQLAGLEGAERSLAYSSGIGAIRSVLESVPIGGEVLCSSDLYGGTFRLLGLMEAQGRARVSFVDPGDLDAVAAALESKPSLLYLETPSNPFLRSSDVEALSVLAHEAGARVAVDYSMLSPLLLQPLALGADYAIQSATKVLGGHSDLTAGVISVRSAELGEELSFRQNAEGAALGPFESWLLLRGMETLAVRLERQLANAELVAAFLAEHTLVDRLHGLDAGTSRPVCPILSFETASAEASREVLRATRLFRTTVSFGGVTSSISMPGEMSHASVPEHWRRHQALPDHLVRLSIGIEAIDDLLADLEQALACASLAATGRNV